MLTALPTASIIRAALWGFGQLFPFSEFFDNPGQSLIQSAEDLLSWFRIGRYQCPPRKEPQDTRFTTSPTCHRIAGCERSVRTVRFPETQVSIVSIALRDQLIHNILVWRAVQRESLTRQGSKAGKIRVRTGRESDRLRWEPEEKRRWMFVASPPCERCQWFSSVQLSDQQSSSWLCSLENQTERPFWRLRKPLQVFWVD